MGLTTLPDEDELSSFELSSKLSSLDASSELSSKLSSLDASSELASSCEDDVLVIEISEEEVGAGVSLQATIAAQANTASNKQMIFFTLCLLR